MRLIIDEQKIIGSIIIVICVVLSVVSLIIFHRMGNTHKKAARQIDSSEYISYQDSPNLETNTRQVKDSREIINYNRKKIMIGLICILICFIRIVWIYIKKYGDHNKKW